ncbi:MAG: class I SAM-dependent methyltransferase [Acetobacteraceae bacterium]|nr:class I SAM-dependent methyltransferase [Acetobacteraceae bacterium]
MAARRILVLPGGLPEALAWAAQARLDGDALIGASMIVNDPAASEYESWIFLPSVLASEFPERFADAVRHHRIDAVYTSHVVVWHCLARMLPDLPVKPRLLGVPPAERARAELDALARRLDDVPFLAEGGGRPRLSRLHQLALLKGATAIPGQSGDDKVWMLSEAARTAPEGDVVEIGSLWGRSAFMLGWLARHYRLGSVLCIDPWSAVEVVQNEASEVVNQIGAAIDFADVRDQFVVNMLACFDGGFNAFVGTSEQAHRWYDGPARPPLETPWFGRTAYLRSIAILHVDGNHDFDAITHDLEMWTRHVAPGGWVVIDDYIWPAGDDGPRRAADAFMAECWDNLSLAVVRGGVLYLRVGGGKTTGGEPRAPRTGRAVTAL